MSRGYRARVVILRRRNFGEADRILLVLGRGRGKLEVISKGSRKLKSKLGGHLELFAEIDLNCALGRNLDVVTGARLVKHYEHIVADYEAMRVGFLLLEIIAKLSSDEESEQLYDLLVESLQALDAGTSPDLVRLYFKLRFLGLAGYTPDLNQCQKSQDPVVSGQRYFFSHELGGIVSEAHTDGSEPEMREDHIKLWRLILQQPLELIAKVGGVERAAGETLPVCNAFYDYLFGKRFLSEKI